MHELVQVITDPTIRAVVGPTVGAGLLWAATAAKNRFLGAPQAVRQRVEQNTDAFADVLAEKIAAKVQANPDSRRAINEELATAKGAAALNKAVEVAAEVEDEFTRENLAELVARRLTVSGASRLQLGTRIATEALVYLTERELRTLAFMTAVQAMRPNNVPGDEVEWTHIVIEWLHGYVSAILFVADPRDLGLLASAGLVDVMPGILGFQLQDSLKSPEGFTPQLEPFLSTDPFGVRVKAAFEIVMRHRLNLAGMILGVTVADRISGSTTDVSAL